MGDNLAGSADVKKFVNAVIVFIGALVCLAIAAQMIIDFTRSQRVHPRTGQIFAQVGILKAGDRLAESGDFNGALSKYNKALGPQYIAKPDDYRSPYLRMVKVYRILGDYDEALKSIGQIPEGVSYNKEIRSELLAMREAAQKASPESVYSYIETLASEYDGKFPGTAKEPMNLKAGIVNQLIRLYSYIGDHQSGIDLMNQMIDLWYKRFPEHDRVATSEEAYKYVIEKGENTPHRPDWLFFKKIRAHLLIKEAFEKDQAEGFKGCMYVDASIENPCVSNAAKALIQSDYFPW